MLYRDGFKVTTVPLSTMIQRVRTISAASRKIAEIFAWENVTTPFAAMSRRTIASYSIPLPGMPACSRRSRTVVIARSNNLSISLAVRRSTSFAALTQWRCVGGVIAARRPVWRRPAFAVREGPVRHLRPVLPVHCQESRHQSVAHCVAGTGLLGSRSGRIRLRLEEN